MMLQIWRCAKADCQSLSLPSLPDQARASSDVLVCVRSARHGGKLDLRVAVCGG